MNTQQVECNTNLSIIFDFKPLDSHLCKNHGVNIGPNEAVKIINICRRLRIPNEKTDAEALIDDLIFEEYTYTKIELISKNRKRELCEARQLWSWFMYGVKKRRGSVYKKNWSLKKIGLKIGRDHSTVIHSLLVVSNLIDTEPGFKGMVKEMLEQLGGKLKYDKYHEYAKNLCEIKFNKVLD